MPIRSCFLRRQVLRHLLAWGAWGTLGFPGWSRTLWAMGSRDYPQGLQKLQGDVRINGITARVGDRVQFGDVVTTGPDGMAVFVIERGVYLVRDNTRLELNRETAGDNTLSARQILTILRGRMLTVFPRRIGKEIRTATAVIGIRGSGAYVESDPRRTYICTCYGIGELMPIADPSRKQTVRTTHHEAPRFIYGTGADTLLETAPVFNHTDAELIMLEAMVGRKPPFVKSGAGHSAY